MATELRPQAWLAHAYSWAPMTSTGSRRSAFRPGVADPVDVLVVTTFDLDEYVFGAVRAGASGFLLKDASPETLLGAICAVAAGQGLIAPEVTRRLIAYSAASALQGPVRPERP